jgi:hypothetical protein
MNSFISTYSNDLPVVRNTGVTTPNLGVVQIIFDPSKGTTDIYLKLDQANHLLEILGPVMADINEREAALAARKYWDIQP